MLPEIRLPEQLFLGHWAPDVAMVERIVWSRRDYLGKLSQLGDLTPADRIASTPLLFAEYLRAVGNADQLLLMERRREVERMKLARGDKDTGRLHIIGPPESAIVADFLRRGVQPDFTPDFEGWLNHLRSFRSPVPLPAGRSAIDVELENTASRRALVPAKGLTGCVLVVAPRGWGKSELLKAIVRHDVEAPNDNAPAGTLIILDPGGDVARQVARWPELSGRQRRGNRLIYIEPGLQADPKSPFSPKLTVGINPLDGKDLDHEGRNATAGMIAEALDDSTAPLTMHMQTLVRHCCTVLLARAGSTLRDLDTMVANPKNPHLRPETKAEIQALYRLALEYPDIDVHRFFEQGFNNEGYRSTREWLQGRLHNLFSKHHLAGMFGGTTTINLRDAIESRKVILVNLARFEHQDDIATAGRLFVTAIAAVIGARSHPLAPRSPVNLVVDEVSLLAGHKIVDALKLLRKYGLNLVMAQQVMGDRFTPAQKAVLTGNVHNRIVGGLDRDVLGDVLHPDPNTDIDMLPQLAERQFWTQWGNVSAQMLNVRSDLADNTAGVSDAEWQFYLAQALDPVRGYYRLPKPLFKPSGTAASGHEAPAVPKPAPAAARPVENRQPDPEPTAPIEPQEGEMPAADRAGRTVRTPKLHRPSRSAPPTHERPRPAVVMPPHPRDAPPPPVAGRFVSPKKRQADFDGA